MTDAAYAEGRQLRSLIREDGTLELFLETVPTPEPAPDEVVVRVEAAPINPSDLGLLFGAADMSTAEAVGTPDQPRVRARVPERLLSMMAGRVGDPMPVGNEGGGVVVGAGDSPDARALLGRVVGFLGGATYSQYRCVKLSQCLVLPEGTTTEQAASCFVNPLTALSMVETMRLEGHSALVHTAAASNLGQMLCRICQQDEVPLVNIVRKDEQVRLLKELGARYVCNSSAPAFPDELADVLTETGATLAFDAIGGGRLASQILGAMKTAAVRSAAEYSRYGSNVHKQVYIYGGLDRGPTELIRSFGMCWGLGGWLLTPFLQRLGREGTQRLKDRVAAEISTTFASHYSDRVPLTGALSLAAIAEYGRQATGRKFLILPNANP